MVSGNGLAAGPKGVGGYPPTGRQPFAVTQVYPRSLRRITGTGLYVKRARLRSALRRVFFFERGVIGFF